MNTTRRSFLQMLGSALGLGVVAKALPQSQTTIVKSVPLTGKLTLDTAEFETAMRHWVEVSKRQIWYGASTYRLEAKPTVTTECRNGNASVKLSSLRDGGEVS